MASHGAYELAILLAPCGELGRCEIVWLEAVADVVVRACALDLDEAGVPSGGELRGVRPDALGVAAECLFERRPLADGAIDEVGELGPAEGVEVGVARAGKLVRGVRYGPEQGRGPDYEELT